MNYQTDYPHLKGVFKEMLVVGMRSASYPIQIYACRQCSKHFAKSSDSEIFEFSNDSKFSTSPERPN